RAGRGGDAEVRGCGGVDGDRVARAGDGTVGRVGGGDRLAAGGLERAAERAGAAGERAVGGQDGLAIAAREVHRAEVAGGRVVELVLGRDREAEGGPGRGGGRSADREVRRGGRVDRDAVARACDRRGHGVGGGDGLA